MTASAPFALTIQEVRLINLFRWLVFDEERAAVLDALAKCAPDLRQKEPPGDRSVKHPQATEPVQA